MGGYLSTEYERETQTTDSQKAAALYQTYNEELTKISQRIFGKGKEDVLMNKNNNLSILKDAVYREEPEMAKYTLAYTAMKEKLDLVADSDSLVVLDLSDARMRQQGFLVCVVALVVIRAEKHESKDRDLLILCKNPTDLNDTTAVRLLTTLCGMYDVPIKLKSEYGTEDCASQLIRKAESDEAKWADGADLNKYKFAELMRFFTGLTIADLRGRTVKVYSLHEVGAVTVVHFEFVEERPERELQKIEKQDMKDVLNKLTHMTLDNANALRDINPVNDGTSRYLRFAILADKDNKPTKVIMFKKIDTPDTNQERSWLQFIRQYINASTQYPIENESRQKKFEDVMHDMSGYSNSENPEFMGTHLVIVDNKAKGNETMTRYSFTLPKLPKVPNTKDQYVTVKDRLAFVVTQAPKYVLSKGALEMQDIPNTVSLVMDSLNFYGNDEPVPSVENQSVLPIQVWVFDELQKRKEKPPKEPKEPKERPKKQKREGGQEGEGEEGPQRASNDPREPPNWELDPPKATQLKELQQKTLAQLELTVVPPSTKGFFSTFVGASSTFIAKATDRINHIREYVFAEFKTSHRPEYDILKDENNNNRPSLDNLQKLVDNTTLELMNEYLVRVTLFAVKIDMVKTQEIQGKQLTYEKKDFEFSMKRHFPGPYLITRQVAKDLKITLKAPPRTPKPQKPQQPQQPKTSNVIDISSDDDDDDDDDDLSEKGRQFFRKVLNALTNEEKSQILQEMDEDGMRQYVAFNTDGMEAADFLEILTTSEHTPAEDALLDAMYRVRLQEEEEEQEETFVKKEAFSSANPVTGREYTRVALMLKDGKPHKLYLLPKDYTVTNKIEIRTDIKNEKDSQATGKATYLVLQVDDLSPPLTMVEVDGWFRVVTNKMTDDPTNYEIQQGLLNSSNKDKLERVRGLFQRDTWVMKLHALPPKKT